MTTFFLGGRWTLLFMMRRSTLLCILSNGFKPCCSWCGDEPCWSCKLDAWIVNPWMFQNVGFKPRLLGNIGFKHCLTSWVRCMLDCRLLECLQAV
jgi:hypothetical protein